MKQYQHEQETRERRGRITGIFLTLGVHAALLATGMITGLKYLDPPPPENTFLLDFTEEEEIQQPRETRITTAPRAENPNPEKDVNLVQRSESPYVSDKPNETPQSKPDDFGDVETPVPPVKEEPKLDPRASFPGMSSNDNSTTTAPHSASESSEGFKAGAPDGNVKTGRTDGTPNAQLKGRTVVGGLPRPSYDVQKEGMVVVQIKVDQYGNVKEAIPGVEGTTVTDKNLWNAARKAAMETHFNMSADAPALQQGTITYRFKLQ